MAQINSVLDTMSYVIGDKGNYIKNLTTAGKGRAQDDKLFTELVLFDNRTFNQLHPLIKGRYVFVVGQMAKFMEILYPKESAYIRVILSTCTTSIDGFEDNTLETAEVTAPTDQNTATYITKLTGKTSSITVTFMSEFTSNVISNYMTTWMHLIYDPGSTAAPYCHLTGLEYHEGNHSMTAVYVVTNPSYQTVEAGAVFYGLVPTTDSSSNILNNTRGEHSIDNLSITFKAQTYTTALPNVMEICKKTLDDYVNRTAVVDYRVRRKPTNADFLM